MTLAVLGVAVGVAGVVLPSPSISWPTFGEASNAAPVAAAPARVLSSTAPTAQQSASARRIYRHSVVPGGVTDKGELAQILRSDRLVAAHYATFNVDNARAVTVTAPRAVYVSYRKNDQIYWTSKKVMLEKGETLLTDGEHEIRARCANRISDVPQFPVEPHGPSEAELDTVLAGGVPSDMVGVPGEEGGLVPVSMDDLSTSEAVGQRYYTTSFPNGAGLLTLANTIPTPTPTPSRQGQPPGLPSWYDTPIYSGGVLGPVGPVGGPGDTVNEIPALIRDSGGSTIPGSITPPFAAGDTGGTDRPGVNAVPLPAAVPAPVPVPEPVPVPVPDGGGNDVPELPVGTPPTLPTPGPGSDTPVPVPGTPDMPGTPGTPGMPGTPDTPGMPGTPATPATPTTPTAPTPPGSTVVEPVPPTEVPEPGTLWLGGIALAALLWLRRKAPRVR